jgi:3-oxoadipate enol-lactonase
VPFLTANNTRIFYRLEGRTDAPVLILSHSLGCDHGMWLPQMPGLLQHFQILRYDTRGHGASDVPAGDYTLDQLGRDVLALADALEFSNFAFCGLSMGSAVGEWLALNAPQRLTRLVLANSSPRFDPANLETRRQTVLASGTSVIAGAVMQRFFSPETLARNDAYAAGIRSVLLGTSAQGYAGCCAALRDADFSQSLGKIRTRTLIIVGDRDQSTPWTGHGELLARGIEGAKVVHLPTAHLSNLEEPEAFTKALDEFLRGQAIESEQVPPG